MDIHEWHDYMRRLYAEEERRQRRYSRMRRLIIAGAVLAAFLNILLLAYIRFAGK